MRWSTSLSAKSSTGAFPTRPRVSSPHFARHSCHPRRSQRSAESSACPRRPVWGASLYESVVGACYIEGGLDAASALVQRTMGDVIAATLAAPRKSPKTLLQEWAQAAHHPLPLYRTLDVSGPEHRRGFVVEVAVAGNVAQGTGASKRAAEEAAAAKLMELVTQ